MSLETHVMHVAQDLLSRLIKEVAIENCATL